MKLFLSLLCVAAFAANETAVELKDILGWKRIQSPIVSPDGLWMAYQLAPNEGDAEVIVRSVKDAKDTKFPIGEIPTPAINFAAAFVPPPSGLAFSEDSKYVAFTVYPNQKEAKRLKKDKKPLVNKVLLVELATGKKTEFERTRRFAFNGKRGGWLAVMRTPAEGQKWQGSDLLLTELATGDQLNIGNVSEFSFDKKGNWLAFVIDAQDMVGNGVQLRNMSNGAVMPLDSAKASYKSLSWTEEGDGLTALRGIEDKGFEDKLYTAIGFTNLAATPVKTVYDPKQDKTFPAGMTVSPNRAATWTKDLSAMIFGIHEVKAKKKGATPEKPEAEKPAAAGAPALPPPSDDKERADLVLWHWADKRLQPQQQVQAQADKNFSYTSIHRIADKKFIQLADEKLRQVSIAEPHVWGLGNDVSKYELQASLNGQRMSDIYSVNLQTGERKMLLEKNRYFYGPSPDGKKVAYSEDGNFFIKDIASGESRNVTKAATTAVFWNQEDDHNVVKPPTGFIGWSKDSSAIVVTDNWDIWTAPWNGKPANLTVNGKKDKIRYRNRFRLDPEEKGIDLQSPMYVATYGEWTKKGGISRIDPAAKAPVSLFYEDAMFNSLIKAKNADTFFYTRESGSEYPNFYSTASKELAGGVKQTDANPQQKDKLWTAGSRVIDYTSAKGDKLQGALFLPANYEPGKKYPTVVYIYEKLSQGANAYAQPTSNGFNKSVYTSNGYAVLMPDITYKLNDPGMSAVWCILPALEAAIATGVVDRDHVGLHGHSWGGYQTAFMVTQTDAFKAAIAGAPLTDMISMYSSIYWNTGSANQPIFESSQGRFTSSYLDNMEAYVRNSPIFHAMKVKTPLIILHNDKDGAVDFTQGIEYYNTLRRLQKQVILLQYKGENHGLRVPANQKDYTVRMKEFFDHHLKGAPAPKWMQEGVPHLKVKEHLDERDPAPAPAAAPKPATTVTSEPAPAAQQQ
jgi:dipeptidyl aminopeptidase/acylaminoacyl peptidase